MKHDRKLTRAIPVNAEAVTARRHQIRATLCLRGLSWSEADAESWTRSQWPARSAHLEQIESLFGQRGAA